MGKYLLFLGGSMALLGSMALGYVLYSSPEDTALYDENATPQPSISNTSATENSLQEEKIAQDIEVYLDFNCPYCRKFSKTSLAPLRKQYQSKIPFHLYHYPLQNAGISLEVAKFYECALEQKNQWDVLDLLYFGYDTFDLQEQGQWIEKLEIDAELVRVCMIHEKGEKKILADKQQGKEKGVRGTPTIFVNGKKFEGNIAKEILEMEILKVKAR